MITKVYVWSIPVVTLDTVAKIDYTSKACEGSIPVVTLDTVAKIDYTSKACEKVNGLYQETFKRLHQILF